MLVIDVYAHSCVSNTQSITNCWMFCNCLPFSTALYSVCLYKGAASVPVMSSYFASLLHWLCYLFEQAWTGNQIKLIVSRDSVKFRSLSKLICSSITSGYSQDSSSSSLIQPSWGLWGYVERIHNLSWCWLLSQTFLWFFISSPVAGVTVRTL